MLVTKNCTEYGNVWNWWIDSKIHNTNHSILSLIICVFIWLYYWSQFPQFSSLIRRVDFLLINERKVMVLFQFFFFQIKILMKMWMNISKKNNETWYHGQIKNLKISLVLFENENWEFRDFLSNFFFVSNVLAKFILAPSTESTHRMLLHIYFPFRKTHLRSLLFNNVSFTFKYVR